MSVATDDGDRMPGCRDVGQPINSVFHRSDVDHLCVRKRSVV